MVYQDSKSVFVASLEARVYTNQIPILRTKKEDSRHKQVAEQKAAEGTSCTMFAQLQPLTQHLCMCMYVFLTSNIVLL